MYKSAELFSETLPSTKTYILNKSDHELSLVIPKAKNRHLYIPSKEIFTLESIDTNHIHTHKIEFDRLLDENDDLIAHNFNVLDKYSVLNKRKEPRYQIIIDAIFQMSDWLHRGTVLNKSESGLQIKTDKPIPGKNVSVYFYQNNKRKSFPGEALWKTFSNGHYYYGLKLNYRSHQFVSVA